MTYFTEIELINQPGGRIVKILPDSVADELDLRPNDELLAINGVSVKDVIDVQYYGAEEYLTLILRRDSKHLRVDAKRRYGQALGIEFEHPTFDVDIRRCNNLCEFCFVLQMAPRFRRTLYIKDDDYRYSFLFGHYVTLTNLTEHDWWRIKNMRLSPLYISVHVTNLDKRRQFLRNQQAPDIIEQLVWLAEHNIKMHTQLVIVPEFNDGNWLVKSINDLAALWPAVHSISLVPVGLTKQHKYGMRTHSKQEAASIIDFAEQLQADFLDQFGLRFVYPTDEWYLVAGRGIPKKDDYDEQQLEENGLGMVRRFLDEWSSLRTEIATSYTATDYVVNGNPLRSVTLVTGTLFGPTLSEVAKVFSTETGLQVNVVEIVNQHLGDSITVAGLLMGKDILDYLLQMGFGDLVIFPRVMFDHPDTISLDDITPQYLASALSRPIALADLMGDVWDAVTGKSAVIYYPD